MGTGRQRSTFISYSRHNKDFAVRLARELKASGFTVWLDQLDIPPGSRWDDELEMALERCEIFMVILTPASMASDNVKDEIGYAIDTRKRILPVLLESTPIPLRLRRFQYVDFSGKSFDEGVDGAKELLRTLIEAQTNPNLEIPPIFRGQDTQVDQAAHEDARRLAAQQAERLAELKAEEERAAKAEADRKAKEEAEGKAWEEAQRIEQKKAEQERLLQAKAEAERKAKAEQRAQAKTEKERKDREAAERLAAQKAEDERAAKVEAERKAKEEAARQAAEKAEEERVAKAEAERKAKKEADRLAAQKAEEERLAKQKAEEERLASAKAENERKAREEAERLARQKIGEERKKQVLPAAPLQAETATVKSEPAKKISRRPLVLVGAVVGLGLCAVVGMVGFRILSNLSGGATIATEEPQLAQLEEDLPTQIAPTEAPPATAPVAMEGFVVLDLSETTQLYNTDAAKGIFSTASEQHTEAELQALEDQNEPIPVVLDNSSPTLIGSGWCATTQEILTNNLGQIEINVYVDGARIPDSKFARIPFTDTDANGTEWQCMRTITGVYQWANGEHTVRQEFNITAKINDGVDDYDPSNGVTEYIVTVP